MINAIFNIPKAMNKKLVIISSGFPDSEDKYLAHTFVRSYAYAATKHFQEIFVLVLIPYIPHFLTRFFAKYHSHVKDYTYKNVSINYLRYPYLPIRPFSSIRGKIAYLFARRKLLKMASGAYIHANFTSPAGVVASELKKETQIDYTLTVHESHDWLVAEIRSSNSLFIKAWQDAKTIVRVNRLDADHLKIYNNNVFPIPNGYDPKTFHILDKSECVHHIGLGIDRKVIVNIGFFTEQKNQKLLIDAVDLLPEAIKKDVLCIIIGGGPLQRFLTEYVTSRGLQDQVKVLGQMKQHDLAYYLNASELFCLSSNSEGNPTVMFEALGCGVPFVGTNVGGVSDIIMNDRLGLLCEPYNARQLSGIIYEGLEKRWDRDYIRNYSTQYTWSKIVEQTIALY
jgi:glycosyltransferase involved in cell wall biosynthesis